MIGSRELQIIAELKDNVSGQLQNIQGRVQKMQPAFQKMAIGGAAAGAGMGYLGKKALDAAGEAEVVQGRFDSVFSATEERTSEWVNNMADEYGRATSTMQSTASNVGGQLQMVAKNLPDQKISTMSKKLSEQSVAMSAYYKNLKSTEDASSAISKALAGQTDRLTEMGYQVGKNSAQFENMRKKLGFAEDQMNSTKEAQVIYNLIMEQNKMVMDAYSETQNSYNERMQIAKEQVKKLSENLGQALIPMMKNLLEKVTPLLQKIAQWVKQNPELTKKIILVTGAIVGLVAIVGALGLALIPITSGFTALIAVLGAVFSPIGLIVGAIAGLVAVIIHLWKTNDNFRNAIISAWEKIKAFLTSAVIKIKNLWNTYFKDMWNSIKIIFGQIKKFLAGFGGWALKYFKMQFGRIKTFWDNWGGTILTVFKMIWNQIKITFKTALSIIRDSFGAFAALLRGDWSGLWNRLKSIFGAVMSFFRETFKNQLNFLVNFSKEFIERIKKPWNIVKEFFGSLMNDIAGFFDPVINKIENIIEKAKEAKEMASNAISSGGSFIQNTASKAISMVPGVNDAVITPKGDVIRTHPDDYIMAMKDPKKSGGNITVNVYGDVSGEELVEKVKQTIMGDLRNNTRISL